jgi:oxygen-independent coproporphyrinogen-3 oxidase
MGKLSVDLELVKKYNVAGPRYTSYPPAPHFTRDVTWPRLEECIRKNNESEPELSLYFHIPFCHSLCWFCGCTTIITRQQSQSATYIEYLKKEMDIMGRLLNPKRKVGQLHFGGGTPTFMLPDEIRSLGGAIRNHFQFSEDIEAGVEIDPRGVTQDHLAALREAGFNRASMGVQDHDPDVQKAVHRIQPREINKQVAGWIREAGFKSLNIDLIYGLPKQNPASFEKTIDEILELQPDRLAIFSYAHVPWMKPAQRILENAKFLPSAETKFEVLKMTIEKLTSEGYVYIGMDHFAKETDELAVAQRQKTLQRNFQGYSTHGGADIYAFGMSSISQIDTAYWQNLKELPAYYAALDKNEAPQVKGFILSQDDRIRRYTIMRVMCDLGLDYEALSKKLQINFTQYFESELSGMADLEADGLIRRSPGQLEVTDAGRLLIRVIAMRFDAYLRKTQEKRFSKTI